LDVSVSEDTRSIDSLRASVQALTDVTKANIKAGSMTALDAAHGKLVIDNDIEDGEVIE